MTRKPAWALELPIVAQAWTGRALLQVTPEEMRCPAPADARASNATAKQGELSWFC